MAEGMTAEERATAYEVEAAQIIDKHIRHLPEGLTSGRSLKLVKLIVEAAVLRMEMRKPAGRCGFTWTSTDGATMVCGRPFGHSDGHVDQGVGRVDP